MMKLPVKRWAYSPPNDYSGFLASEDQLPLQSGDNHRENFEMSDSHSIQKRMSSNSYGSDGEMFQEGRGVNFAQQHWSHIVFASLLAVVALAAVGVTV